MSKFTSIAAFAVTAFFLSFGTANAATCSVSDTTPGANACAGGLVNNTDFNGNVSASNVATAFGGIWSEVTILGEGAFNSLYSVGTGTNPSFVIFSPTSGYDYAFTIKSSTKASIYLFSAATVLDGLNASGDFLFSATTAGTAVNGNGKAQGISNSGLFKREDVSTVPLPAAGWLLILGLGGLAAMRRKRTA